MISHSENAKGHKNQQIPIAKREKRAFCQNRRFAAGNLLKKICKIAEFPHRKHGFRSTNAQKPHRRISDSWVVVVVVVVVLLLLLLLLLVVVGIKIVGALP